MPAIKVRLSDEQHNLLLKNCKTAGKSKSEFVRDALNGINVNQKINPKHSFALLTAVNQIKNNINLMAIKLNKIDDAKIDEINNQMMILNHQLNQVLNVSQGDNC